MEAEHYTDEDVMEAYADLDVQSQFLPCSQMFDCERKIYCSLYINNICVQVISNIRSYSFIPSGETPKSRTAVCHLQTENDSILGRQKVYILRSEKQRGIKLIMVEL